MDEERKKQRKGDLTYLGLGFALSLLIVFAGFVIIQVWPFGDGTVLIIDSLHQYLPFYTELNEKLRTGQSLLYDFSAGLGYDFWGTIAYYMASPFNLLLVLVPRRNVADYMDLMIMLKIAACGGVFSFYLHRRDPKRVFLPIAFGCMFALGNFMIGYYFNLMWLDSIAVLPLIMMGIENITAGKKGLLYGLSLFYALWCNYYIGFMLCIFACLYFAMCSLCRRGLSLRQLLQRAVRFGVYSLLAGGCASIILLPAYRALSSSEAVRHNSFPSSIRFYTDFLDLVTAHFAQQHPINISDTQVGLNAYCGTAVLILVLLYIVDEKIDLRKKIGYLVLLALFLLSFSMNILSYIWHGFHIQNGLPNRFAFIYICLLLVVCFDTLQHIKTIAPWKILLCSLIAAGFAAAMILLDRTDAEYGMWNILTPVLLAVYALLFLIIRLSACSYKTACMILGAFLFLEAGAHGIYGIIYNENVTRSIYLEDQEAFGVLTSERGDTDFYRAEIDSQRMRNVTMYAGGNSVVMFNSTMQESVTSFCDHIGMEARTNKNGYIGVTTLMNDVLGIRYVCSSSGKGNRLYQMDRISEYSGMTMYYNENALPVGFMTNSELRYWDIYSGNPIDVQNSFVRLACGWDEDLYVLDRTVELNSDETVDVKIPEGKQVYLYLPERVEKIEVDTPEYKKSYSTYTDHLYVIHSLGEENMASFTPKLKSSASKVTASLYTCRDEDTDKIAEQLGAHVLENATISGNRLQGDIDAGDGGILLLTVPWSENWKVTVDGEKAVPVMIGSALTGLDLSAGEHTISMIYTPGGFYKGALLSALSILLLIAFALFERKQGEKMLPVHFSKRAAENDEGIFARLNEKKEELQQQGKTIYNLSVGTPDFPVGFDIRRAVCTAARDPENYKYALKDLDELTEAVCDFYQRRFGVSLESDEVMSVYGSQEGMAHIAWVFCDPGDMVLVPNPGYPIFKTGALLCGAKVWEYPLTEENGYLPDLDSIPEDVAMAARYMVVSYPGNPLGRCAPDSVYEKLIDFAKKYQIVIVHDNAYADIVFDGREGKSFLSFPGAKEVGVEFYSLSKTFDYTGARLSFVVGSADIVSRFRSLRSQFDYGIFLPVQYGAIAALRSDFEPVRAQCAEYELRSRTLCRGLREIGWDVPDTEGTMFVWAPLPKDYTNSEEFCLKLMEQTGVIVTPGSSFGSLGEGYVRFALVMDSDKLKEAVDAIAAFL